GVFPEPQQDSVIQVASVVQRQGAPEPFLRVVFCLQPTAPILGCQVLSFPSEKQLLQVWGRGSCWGGF
ncbi:DPOD1 polymerase, partial [Indicator maculatus]|nr:DPOD1 polymerase [Indicator maculatus]